MNHTQYIDKTVIAINVGFEGIGKVHLQTSTNYNHINLSTPLNKSALIQNSGGALIANISNAKVSRSYYYNYVYTIHLQLGKGKKYSVNDTEYLRLILPLKPGIKDKRIIDFIFNDNDKVKKQPSTDITFIFGEHIPPNCSPIRNGNTNNFDCRCAPLIGTSNNFEVSCDTYKPDFGFIEAYYGDNFASDFIRTSKASVFSGTSASTSIDYRTQKDISPIIQHGSTSSVNVSYNYFFKVAIGFGASVSTVIDYRPQLDIPVNVLQGDNVSSNLSRTAGFEPKISYGESFAFNITPQYSVYFDGTIYDGTNALIDIFTSPSSNVTVSAYSGDLLVSSLNIATTIETVAQYGENIITELNTNTVFVPLATFGSVVETAILYKEPTVLDFNALTGDNVSSVISSSTNILPTVQTGDNVDLNLSYFISTGSEFYAYTGETTTFNITTYAYIKSNVYSGDVVTSELDVRPPKDMTVRMSHGESAVTDTAITTTYITQAYVGDRLDIGVISTAKNTYLYYGDEVNIELASQSSFDNNRFRQGENVVGTIKYAPSEPIGTFNVQHGTNLHHNIQTEISTFFRPKFSFNIEFEQTIWDSTYVDMNRYNCCPPKVEDLLHVNLQRDKEVEVKYDIPHQFSVMTDLVAAPILYPKISHGTTFSVVDYDMLLTANFRYGDNVDVLDLYNDLVVDLNSGNPELDSDNVLIETSKDYTEFKNSFAEIGDGTCVDIELAVVHGITAEMGFGLKMHQLEFVVESAWRMYFYGFAGARAQLNTNVQFRGLNMRMGTELRHQFYEEPLRMQSGENFTCDIIIEYDVEFMDDGCLDNNHIPTTPEGIPIVEETNEMAIEGQYYSRYIRGRCY